MAKNLLLLGRASSGKTAILNYMKEKYPHVVDEFGVTRFDIPRKTPFTVMTSLRMDEEPFDGVIIVTADVEEDLEEIKKSCGNIPKVVLFNKFDLIQTKRRCQQYIRNHPEEIFCSSVTSGYGVEKPFFSLIA